MGIQMTLRYERYEAVRSVYAQWSKIQRSGASQLSKCETEGHVAFFSTSRHHPSELHTTTLKRDSFLKRTRTERKTTHNGSRSHSSLRSCQQRLLRAH